MGSGLAIQLVADGHSVAVIDKKPTAFRLARNHWLFNRTWGVDIAVSTPHQFTAMVDEEAVSVGTLVRLLQLGDGGASLVEVTLAADSPVVGRLISEIDVPREATIVAIVRHRDVIVPRGDTRLVTRVWWSATRSWRWSRARPRMPSPNCWSAYRWKSARTEAARSAGCRGRGTPRGVSAPPARGGRDAGRGRRTGSPDDRSRAQRVNRSRL